jgi:hypothetical protein
MIEISRTGGGGRNPGRPPDGIALSRQVSHRAGVRIMPPMPTGQLRCCAMPALPPRQVHHEVRPEFASCSCC